MKSLPQPTDAGLLRDLDQLAQPRTSHPWARLNAISPYYTMFPLSFPLQVLRGARPGWVLDPFCGRGTTNYAARVLGFPTVGVDVNPIAAAIAQAKLVSATAEGVANRCRAILASGEPRDVPEGAFWQACFHPRTLQDICRLREALAGAEAEEDVLLRALVLGVLHGPRNKGLPSYLSNQMPRTYATKPDAAVRFWRRKGLEPVYVNVLDVIERRARYLLAHLPAKVPGHIRLADSRALAPEDFAIRFRYVITSPPYFGMKTYVSDHWLRNWFLGGPPHVDYASDPQLGRSSLPAFIEGLREVWTRVSQVCEPGALLVVRFGAIPSYEVDPVEVLRASLRGTPWKERRLSDAGSASNGRRQADQFQFVRSRAALEVDLYASLEEA
ncbi:DNA modification methylase [Alicyclobacillus sendaiensis]|uniref:DNA modification methylase n=1 Tax=Alicyclobacillus sendaiensis TaxID=192387 RepID=UPI0026F420BC|nr:DNA modification methylase [Alicyclobacillus sendaiensis]